MPLTLNTVVDQEREIFLVKFANKAKKDEVSQIKTDLDTEVRKVEQKELNLQQESENFDLFIDETNKKWGQLLLGPIEYYLEPPML